MDYELNSVILSVVLTKREYKLSLFLSWYSSRKQGTEFGRKDYSLSSEGKNLKTPQNK